MLVSGGRDLETVAGLQDVHLNAVLSADVEREIWPTTGRPGKLHRPPKKIILKLNRYLPGISELLALRGVKMLASTFGEGLIERLNPITGRLHPSFRIGSTIAGRFTGAGPKIQQQPAPNKAFRSIFRSGRARASSPATSAKSSCGRWRRSCARISPSSLARTRRRPSTACSGPARTFIGKPP